MLKISLATIGVLVLPFWAVTAQSTPANPQANSTVSAKSAVSEERTFEHYLRLAPDIKPPKATYAPDPPFPKLPPNHEDEGHVVLLVGVKADGRVGPIRVLRNDLEVFEQSAIETVKTWRFKPARKNGKPVPVQVSVEISFKK